MIDDKFQLDRSTVTFEQAEGLASLPVQLQPKEVSQELRAFLWRLLWKSLNDDIVHSSMGYKPTISGKWADILIDHFVYSEFRMIDEFDNRFATQADLIKMRINHGSYSDIFGWVQWVLRHRRCPNGLAQSVDKILIYCRSAYRVINQTTIIPLAFEEERQAIQSAFLSSKPSIFKGARSHLYSATSDLSDGNFADSVRNSIHAVEAVARVLTQKDKLSEALSELERNVSMHKAMKRGFDALYGWTSDEEGIRHPLLAEGDAKVSEADAIFMLGACASFVSFLINRGHAAGLVPT